MQPKHLYFQVQPNNINVNIKYNFVTSNQTETETLNDIPKKSPLILKSGTRTVDPILKLIDDLHNFPDELSRAKIKTNDNDQKPKNTQYFLTTAVPIINNQLPIIAEHISSNKALSLTTTQAKTTRKTSTSKIKQTTTSATTPTPSSSSATTTIATATSSTSSKRRIESFGPADFLRLCFQEGIGCDFSLKRNLNKLVIHVFFDRSQHLKSDSCKCHQT